MVDTDGYTISRARRRNGGYVTFDCCTYGLQRFSVTMRYENTSAEVIDRTIRHALEALNTPPKPIGVPVHG